MGLFDRIAGQLGELITPDDVRAHVDRGAALLEGGDYDGAVRELSLALGARPDHPRAALLLGWAELRRGRPDVAEQALRGVLASRPDLAEAEIALGEALQMLGRFDEAREAFTRGLDGGVSDTRLRGEAGRGLGRLYLAAGRGDKAVRELRKAAAALPGDAEVQRLLGEALLGRGDLDGARLCLERASGFHGDGGTASEVTSTSNDLASRNLAEALTLLGETYRRSERLADAEAAWRRAVAVDLASAAPWLGLSELSRAAGEREAAHSHANEALRRAGDERTRVPAYLALARSEGDPAAAMAHYQAALAHAGEASQRALLDEALHFALRAEALARPSAERVATSLAIEAGRLGALLLARDGLSPATLLAADLTVPERSDALAAVALAAFAEGSLDEADRLVALALTQETLEALLASACLALARAELEHEERLALARSLRRAAQLASPDDHRARALLARLHRASHPPLTDALRRLDSADERLHVLLRAAHRQLQGAAETSDLAPELARVAEILDRPLLLTVMGEFNAGKSTFVNALLGEEVAPMGITPTTATINVLKYGVERGGRVVYRDDRVRQVPWSEVGALLRSLDEEEATRIRYVEVLYPLETLQRVNIVDTPGLNSIRPEHEATAREFIAQADAVIWLFTCRQPGTKSEREALLKIREAHKRALGVVNQIDRVESEADRDELLAHLRDGFGELVEGLVPFSAREALLGRSDPERRARSNREALEHALEEHYYARAKSIQRGQATRRLRALVEQALKRAEAAREQGPRDALIEARRAGDEARARLPRFLNDERLALVADLDEVYAQAAREVLDFVRPRRSAFGENQATPADRDFLVGLVEEQLGALASTSSRRVGDEARRMVAALARVAPREAEALLGEELRLLDEQVYGRYRAFTRGFLRGGRVDEFFLRALPRLELGEQAIRRALLRDLPALDVLEAELLAPLHRFAHRFVDELARRADALLADEGLRRMELEERLVLPLTELTDALSGLPPDEDAEAPR